MCHWLCDSEALGKRQGGAHRLWKGCGQLMSDAAAQEPAAAEAFQGAVGLAEEWPHATPPRGRLGQQQTK